MISELFPLFHDLFRETSAFISDLNDLKYPESEGNNGHFYIRVEELKMHCIIENIKSTSKENRKSGQQHTSDCDQRNKSDPSTVLA